MGMLGSAARAVTRALLSAQVGGLTGFLAQRVLGQYDMPLLDTTGAPRLLLVGPNLGNAAEKMNADVEELLHWVTLHEVTHAVQFAGVPWLHPHVSGLVKQLLQQAEVRIDAPRKLRMPSLDELRHVGKALKDGDIISIVTTTAERETLDRVQAVMAVIEGHAEHVMDAVAPDLLPSLPKLRASLDRRRKSQTGLSRLVARLLGLELKLRQYEQGKFFCDEIVRERGVEALHHLWSGPEALPTLAELRDPASWLARTMPRELESPHPTNPPHRASPDAAA
jgi:coenzyme F420 biosynthesis associated uncharacterized protein